MRIEEAKVVAGSETPAGDGVTGAMRCILILGDGSRRAAVIKRGPLEEVAAEVYCALLLRSWGLSVPDPYLVPEDAGLAFASADDGYPNLKQALSVSQLPAGPIQEAASAAAMRLVASLSSTPLAVACDEAIDNRDRNLGNILWDGANVAWIDHARCVGLGAAMHDLNKLCLMAVHIGASDKVSRGAIAQALVLDADAPAAIRDAASGSKAGDLSPMAAFVSSRMGALATKVLSRFPQPSDLLAGIGKN